MSTQTPSPLRRPESRAGTGTTESPIGGLYLDAQSKAKMKANGHESTAPCGCAVTVTFFSDDSHRTDFSRCIEHPKKRPS